MGDHLFLSIEIINIKVQLVKISLSPRFDI